MIHFKMSFFATVGRVYAAVYRIGENRNSHSCSNSCNSSSKKRTWTKELTAMQHTTFGLIYLISVSHKSIN